jgi:ribosome-binding ATPase YchF (GTP1/OBG family)
VAALRTVREQIAAGEHPTIDPGLIDLQLLSAKPVIFVFNSDAATLSNRSLQADLAAVVAPAESLFLDAGFEAELSNVPEPERSELAALSGLDEPGLDRLIRAAYRALGLQSFLTTGPKETRAWTIPANATAVEAAGVIHTDFARGFIAAEVVSFDRLVEAGSWQAAKAAGLVRSEGKAYVLRPDDVVEFRFNV